ncbi:hypothetical protein PAAG_05275 [Paracoccidioides lutzii Pb01]|uniref:Uncharacterized protein n=1 Tax=Paracoccidioides lutzii (strain ATCC MYA-826 / Pb01) TaxID=502779 RepID=C1H3D2_PARBA|nr:hypothetical protein PAAG_05275 [Paracoccidioides lutzii Pb01]EEH34226.2 hypothetical protein PAAG_05275 [Paracoccidioides lutzii Pb01]
MRSKLRTSRDQNPKIWDVITGNCLKILEAHTDRKPYHCSVTGIIPSRTQKTTSPLAMNFNESYTFAPPPYTKSSTLGRAEQFRPAQVVRRNSLHPSPGTRLSISRTFGQLALLHKNAMTTGCRSSSFTTAVKYPFRVGW